MKILVALAVCLAVAQSATINFYQPVSFQPNQEPIAINPSLPALSPIPVPGTVYHEINVPHYDGAPLIIIKVNVIKVEQPEPETPIFQNLPAFLPADYAKPTPAFSPADLSKPLLAEDGVAQNGEARIENQWKQEVTAGPLVKIIVNIAN